MGEAGAERLYDRLLCGKAHRQEPHRTPVAAEGAFLLGQQQPADEMLSMARIDRLDARKLHDVGAYAEDHQPAPRGAGRDRRASSISAFISLTAAAMPATIARATIACPMLSSTISSIAATGWTL